MAALQKRSAQPAPAGRAINRTQGEIEHHIEGRFRRISVHQLTLAWWLHTAGHLTRRQLRIYFAAHEMHERRRYTGPAETPRARQRKPRYSVEELAALVGGRSSPSARNELRADVKRLATVGLVKLSQHAVEFAVSADQISAAVGGLTEFWALLARMPNNRRTVPVPRRTLRALAAGFSRGVTAVMLAMLIRSLFWRRESENYRVDGRTKGSWIADVFGVSRRAVTEARQTLIELGWIVPLDAPQWALNRWGSHDRINPAWAGTAGSSGGVGAPDDGRAVHGGSKDVPGRQSPTDAGRVAAVGEASRPGESASPGKGFSGESASPCLDRSSSLTGKHTNTRRLGGPAPAGVSTRGTGRAGTGHARREWGRRNPRAAIETAPSIRDIQPRHLVRTEDLLELYRQAVEAKLAHPSEAGRLDFLAMAERARAHGKRAGALLFWLLREKKTRFITHADEEAAARRLREWRDGPSRRRRQWGGGDGDEPTPTPATMPELTEEQKFVLACIRVAKQCRGIEPFEIARLRGWSADAFRRAREELDTRDDARWRSIPGNGG